MTNILLLEDDETISFGIGAALKKKGYEVLNCPSIAKGKLAFSQEISLVLLDLNLPDGTGYEFCKWVKEQRDIPIIFLTVRDGAKDIIKGLDMGGDDYITKPFHLSVLESRIKAVLRRASKKQSIPRSFPVEPYASIWIRWRFRSREMLSLLQLQNTAYFWFDGK